MSSATMETTPNQTGVQEFEQNNAPFQIGEQVSVTHMYADLEYIYDGTIISTPESKETSVPVNKRYLPARLAVAQSVTIDVSSRTVNCMATGTQSIDDVSRTLIVLTESDTHQISRNPQPVN